MRIEMVMTRRTMMGELGCGVRRLAEDLCGRGHEARVAVLGSRVGEVDVFSGCALGERGVLHFHLESRRRLVGCFRALGRLGAPAVFTFHEPRVVGSAGHAPGWWLTELAARWVGRRGASAGARGGFVMTASHPWGGYWFPEREWTSPMLVGVGQREGGVVCGSGRTVVLLVGAGATGLEGWIRRFEWEFRRRVPGGRVVLVAGDLYGAAGGVVPDWKRVPKGAVLALMRRSRVICCVGWGSGSGEPFRDAASVGLPMVAEEGTLARRWLRSGTAGLIVRRERMADAVIRLCLDDGMWRHLSGETLRMHAEGTRWDAARWFERVYRLALRGREEGPSEGFRLLGIRAGGG
jgi:hypothetical protein